MTNRIGPKMRAAVAYVAAHPGCPKIGPATWVAPCKSGNLGLQYGYRTVDRAIEAGLIRCERVHGSRYALFAVEQPMTTIQRDEQTFLVPAI